MLNSQLWLNYKLQSYYNFRLLAQMDPGSAFYAVNHNIDNSAPSTDNLVCLNEGLKSLMRTSGDLKKCKTVGNDC